MQQESNRRWKSTEWKLGTQILTQLILRVFLWTVHLTPTQPPDTWALLPCATASALNLQSHTRSCSCCCDPGTAFHCWAGSFKWRNNLSAPCAGAPMLCRAAHLYPLGLRGDSGMDLQPLIFGPPDALFSPTHPSGVWTAGRIHWIFLAWAFGNSVLKVEVEHSAEAFEYYLVVSKEVIFWFERNWR